MPMPKPNYMKALGGMQVNLKSTFLYLYSLIHRDYLVIRSNMYE